MLHGRMLKNLLSAVVVALLLVPAFAIDQARAADAVKQVRLYALDCGRGEFKDMGMFSDTGEYDGKSGAIVVPCFVIRHPKGTLIWDTGLGDKLAANKDGMDAGNGIHLSVPVTLAEQLKALGLAPSDVSYVAFSHFHFDHTGNANLFGAATWIINKLELAWAEGTPTPSGVDPTTISAYKTAKTQLIDGDYDVFGDGSVRILKAPGHTPGHQVLELKLAKSGVVILSGDLYHTDANRSFKRVPTINVERADTLASIERIERIVKNTHARFVIQHDPNDFKSLPKFPAYLD
ncbi:MAG: N-acyl homoserine lactonase family protein [Nevskia sp.]|nr:N-acyl homoserine lactonase family protein [Nevskia sp.]